MKSVLSEDLSGYLSLKMLCAIYFHYSMSEIEYIVIPKERSSACHL